MKKMNRILSALTAGAVMLSLISGCSDSELDDFLADDESGYSEAADISSEQETTSSDAQRGTGLEEISITGTPDADPDKQIVKSRAPIKQVRGINVKGEQLSDDFYFYRALLSSQYKQAYDQIYAMLYRGVSTFDMNVAVSANDISDIVYSVYYDHPELFWVDSSLTYYYNGNGQVTSLTVNFNGTANDLKTAQKYFESAVSNLLLKASTLDTDIEKVKYVHDYLTNTINYVSNSAYNQSAYSALVLGQTVCAGYAHAFQYCMQKLGIPAAYIVGHAGESHAWNLLKLDGEYYNMDVTWDDPIGNPATTYYYDYFNVTDSVLNRDHSRYEISAALPAANGTKYSYASWYGSGNFGSDFSDFGAIDGVIPSEYNGNTTAPAATTAATTTTAAKTTSAEIDYGDISYDNNDYSDSYDDDWDWDWGDDDDDWGDWDEWDDFDWDDFWGDDWDDEDFSDWWGDDEYLSDFDWGFGNDCWD